MTTIAQLDKPGALALERRFQRAIHRAPTLEAAAQRYVETVYAELSDSIVLLRLFATVRFRELPDRNREFVRSLGEATGALHAITDDTLVLSLLGTMGVESAWCDRHQSVNHVGIPLLSREFVAAIPMIARLLKQLGVELDWIDRKDTAMVGKTFGVQSGVFYVADAATAVDSHNRKIIAAQEFVARYRVGSVWGVGGGYVGTPVYAIITAFCRDRFDAERVEGFRSHIDRFKAETVGVVQSNCIFA
jgi:hypothetical protein